jgi:hypothetical protein
MDLEQQIAKMQKQSHRELLAHRGSPEHSHNYVTYY